MSNIVKSSITLAPHHRGITLIELMVVAAIIGILGAIAVPAYQDYVREARRNTAQGQMVELSAALERFFSDNNDYTNFPMADAAGNLFPDHLPKDVPHANRRYDLALADENGIGATPGPNGYTITSTPTQAVVRWSTATLRLIHAA